MSDLIKLWDDYYQETFSDAAIRDKNFARMEIDALVNGVCEEIEQSGKTELNVLEIGSGTGFFAQHLSTALQEKYKIKVSFTGVDFSEVGVKRSEERKIPYCDFVKSDFMEFLENDKSSYDIIISSRSIMAILEIEPQLHLINLLKDHLKPDGLGLFSEATAQGAAKVNEMRQALSLEPTQKIWHCLYVDEEKLQEIFSSVIVNDFASLYWMITRVIYPYFEEPVHNTPLHDFAAALAQEGNYGLVKLFKVRA